VVRNPGHKNAGRWIWLAVVLVKPINAALFKRRWRGHEHVPATGGVVLVSNHVSQADWLTFAEYAWDAGRIPRFLAKDSLSAAAPPPPATPWTRRSPRSAGASACASTRRAP
jgi:1-acyl-sn-glycerol-3-phosphate acyltransferase